MAPIIPEVRRFPIVLLAVALSCCKPVDRGGMVRIEGGELLMGSDRGFPFEGPVHRVVLDSFWLDETEVTNEAFGRFIEATGRVTTAERIGNSGVFSPAQHGWTLVDGADWRHPEGPGSSIDDRLDHPVVHVSWEDADGAYLRMPSSLISTPMPGFSESG
jgi:formylglycine-generating enzyme